MKKDTLSKEEKLPQPEEPQSAHATPIVEKYVEKRKDKAEKQANEEEKGTSHAQQSKSIWDEWTNLKYVIL